MCTLKCQALRNELRILKGEGEQRDPSVEAPRARVICQIFETASRDMTLCVSSKVDRYQMAKDVFDKIKALQVVLPMLLEGAQLVRMDVLP